MVVPLGRVRMIIMGISLRYSSLSAMVRASVIPVISMVGGAPREICVARAPSTLTFSYLVR